MRTATQSSEFERYQAEEKVRKDRNRDAQRKYRISVKRRLSESTKLHDRIAELERLIVFLQTTSKEHESAPLDFKGSQAPPCTTLVESQHRSSIATAGANILGESRFEKSFELNSKEQSSICNNDDNLFAQTVEFECNNLSDYAEEALRCVDSEPDLRRIEIDDKQSSIVGGARTAISAAAESGNIEMVKVLIDHGANIMGVDGSGTTAIHKAFEGCHYEVASLLFRHAPTGAANQTDISGKTVLGIAIENSHVELARLALRHGANVDYI